MGKEEGRKQMNILVLGGGKIGSVIARELNKKYSIRVLDSDPTVTARLNYDYGINTYCRKIEDTKLFSNLLSEMDLVVNALPGRYGFEALKIALQNKKNVVDVSFFPEDVYQLDALAKENGVSAIVDCGLAPGSCNILIGHATSQMDSVEKVLFRVGGLPQDPPSPWYYFAPYCCDDVLEFYSRQATIISDGKLKFIDPLNSLTEIHYEFDGCNDLSRPLESFITDDLRTLLRNIEANNMVGYTYRYLGHLDNIKKLNELGLFKYPESTSKTLSKLWSNDSFYDVTYADIHITGHKDGKEVNFEATLIDTYDEKTHTSSMARTTGYTACIAVDLMVQYKEELSPGIIAPETLGMNQIFYEFFEKKWIEKDIQWRIS